MCRFFSEVKNPRTLEGKITRSRRLLLFEGRQKISGLESIWQLQNPGSMKKFRIIRKDSGLQSGSREIYSPTKLSSAQIWFKNVRFKKELTSRKFELKGRQKISGWKWRFRFAILFKGRLFSHKALKLSLSGSRSRFKKNLSLAKRLKITEEDLLPWCAVQTWVSCLIGLTYYWSHGGFCFIKRGLCLSHHARLHGVVLFKAASGLPLDICFLYITRGLGRVRTNEHPLIGDSHQIIWGHGQVWTSHASWSA